MARSLVLTNVADPSFGMLFHKRHCVFIAFDLLFLNGKDLRTLPLIKRKAELKKLLRRKRSRILYLDHVETDGRLLFEQIVRLDLEGIVCKRKDSPYKVTEQPSRYWIKVKNRGYSQLVELKPAAISSALRPVVWPASTNFRNTRSLSFPITSRIIGV